MALGLGLAVSVASAGLAVTRKNPTIAVFTKNFTNPAYEAFRIGAEKVAKAANARVVHYVPKQPDSIAEQTAAIEQTLIDRPDIVLFTPVDGKAMAAPVKKLNDANIPIVLFTNEVAGRYISFVGSDDVDLGYKEAVYLFKHMGGKACIVILEGVPAASTNRDRLLGYRRALAEFPGIVVLASGVGNFQRPDGRDVMAGMLTAHANIDAVLAANDSMALGVLDALKAANRSAVVMSINGVIDAVRQVEAGAMLATVDFNMFKIACIATQAALRHLNGQPVPDKIVLPTEIIDKTNYKAWLVPVADRLCPQWEDFVG